MIRWIRLECLQVFNKQMVSANDCKMFIAAGKFTMDTKFYSCFLQENNYCRIWTKKNKRRWQERTRTNINFKCWSKLSINKYDLQRAHGHFGNHIFCCFISLISIIQAIPLLSFPQSLKTLTRQNPMWRIKTINFMLLYFYVTSVKGIISNWDYAYRPHI